MAGSSTAPDARADLPWHRLENPPAACILTWQLGKMLRQVTLHLPLRFGDEPQAHFIAERCGGHADGKGAYIPQRVEPGGGCPQLSQPLLTPGQMITLLGSRAQQEAARGR